MIPVCPALVISGGQHADAINERISTQITFRNALETSPPVFGFLSVPDNSQDINPEIVQAYADIRSQFALKRTEQTPRFTVDTNGVDVFLVFPFDQKHCEQAIRISALLRECSSDGVSMTRNAIFLVSKKLLSLGVRNVQSALVTLNTAMQEVTFPFHRCFFVDEVNEQGQTITRPDELFELVARFISLTVASNMSEEIKKHIPKYAGVDTGMHPVYASFSCSTIGFDADKFAGGLSQYLAKDIAQSLFRDSSTEVQTGDAVEKPAQWFKTNWITSSQKVEDSDIEGRLQRLVVEGKFDLEYGTILGRLQSPGISMDDPTPFSQYQEAEKNLDAYTHQVLPKRRGVLREYAGFLDESCRHNQVHMEAFKEEAEKEVKRKISGAHIAIICEIDPFKVTTPGYTIPRDNPWKWLGIALTILGIILLGWKSLGIAGVAPVIEVGGWIDYAVIGVMILVGIVLWLHKPDPKIIPPSIVNIFWLMILNMRRFMYKLYYELITIWLHLYLRLDWAYMNIGLLKNTFLSHNHGEQDEILGENEMKLIGIKGSADSRSYLAVKENVSRYDDTKSPVYDLHLEDQELTQKYYAVKYGNAKAKDIEMFVSPANMNNLHRSLFSYPAFKLCEYLMQYCNDKFKQVKEFTLEKMVELREELIEEQKSQPPSSPFWNPISSANEEKVVIASLPSGHGDKLRNFVEGMFTGQSITFIETQPPEQVMLVQVSYGLQLWEVFKMPSGSEVDMVEIGVLLGLTEDESEAALR